MNTDTVMLPEVKFANIPLNSIVVDPNQPRSFFDQHALDELTDSIREKGVLQPIMVRPSGKKYMIVCGERRYKAALSINSTFKDRNSIPAVIRAINDDEALELQIIENLQRKDVHPMEEAVAFKSLVEHGKDLKEIAAKIGKSEFYARQRMKLNALSEDWQKAFFAGRITNSLALTIAMFDSKQQTDIYKNHASGRSVPINLGNWDLSRYRGELMSAPFDLSDDTLDKKMGACINCKFNSATAALFPESAISPKCSNIACYKGKCDNSFIREFEAAMEDPLMIFVHDNFGNYSDKFTAKLLKAGIKTLDKYSYDEVNKPDYPDWEDWKEDYEDDYDVSEAELKQIFEKEQIQDYDKRISEYNTKISSGKYKKAFMLSGNDRGKYVFLQLRKRPVSGTSKESVKNVAEQKVTAEDIDSEIKRIQDKEKRTKEIDQNKIWEDLKKQFNPSVNASMLKEEFTQVEREAIATAIANKLSYQGRDHFRKLFKVDGRNEDFTKVDEITLRQMIRFFFLDTLPPVVLYSGYTKDALTCIKVAGQYFPSVLKDIMQKQNDIAEKRQARIAIRIADLKATKKELSGPKTSKKKQ